MKCQTFKITKRCNQNNNNNNNNNRYSAGWPCMPLIYACKRNLRKTKHTYYMDVNYRQLSSIVIETYISHHIEIYPKH